MQNKFMKMMRKAEKITVGKKKKEGWRTMVVWLVLVSFWAVGSGSCTAESVQSNNLGCDEAMLLPENRKYIAEVEQEEQELESIP